MHFIHYFKKIRKRKVSRRFFIPKDGIPQNVEEWINSRIHLGYAQGKIKKKETSGFTEKWVCVLIPQA